MTKRNDETGFSLIEVVISMGLLALLVQGMMSFFKYMHSTDRATQQRMEARDLVSSLRQLLRDKYQCTQNLSGVQFPLGPSAAPGQVSNFQYFDKSTGSSQPLARLGQTLRAEHGQGITPVEFQVRYKAKYPSSPTRYIADLTIGVRRDVQAAGGQPSAPTESHIPLMVTLNGSGSITECWADAFTSGDLNTQQLGCALVPPQGLYRYDPSAGKCVRNCFSDGSPTSASCPAGSTIKFCEVSGANLTNGTAPVPPRSYTGPNGATTSLTPPIPNVFPAVSGNGCTCTWANVPGVPNASNICVACCAISNINGISSGSFVPDPHPPL